VQTDELRMIDASGAIELPIEQAGRPSFDLILCITCRWLRNSWKYRYSRNYRMVMLELGHAAQTMRLVATALGLDAYCTLAIADGVMSEQLQLPDDLVESPMCAIGVRLAVASRQLTV
jgi:nitroreductase